ncbi:MAG: hypothetical protein KF852_09065 [Saprospiraceae bacterium]|nr:hypothetical protein [Saprospiraceae bacterium]
MHKTIFPPCCLLIGAMRSLDAQNHSNKFSGQLMVGANDSFWEHPPANLLSNGFANKAKPANALPRAMLGMNFRMPVFTLFSVETGIALAQRRGKVQRMSYYTYRLTHADWIQAPVLNERFSLLPLPTTLTSPTQQRWMWRCCGLCFDRTR